ncbi:MAG TPA: CoA transferase [Terriglobales bacterium]|nr:CoA transferase [Terriglobales bacterium]
MDTSLLNRAWAATAGEGEAALPGPPAPLRVTGPVGHLPSRFPVEDAAIACVGAALLAAAALPRQRSDREPDVAVDRAHVAAAVRSESLFRLGDRAAGPGFAPLSRFWRTADGWVRTHANYPWHRAALLRVLGVSGDADEVAAALAERRARDVEERVFAAGGVAAAVRSFDEWGEHAQGRALASEPLVARRTLGNAAPRRRAEADLPLAGVRVLDLTRVIAGPVCTRFLAALGADVLRIDPPGHPDLPPGTADTLLGKRSAFVDLASRDGLDMLHGLLAGADVLVQGYRPASLERFGLGFEHLAERHPGLVTVVLDAWGHSGPWSGRRGFDSIVQAASGIAAGESPDGARPGALPCQLLDHGTGYLAAAAALDGLRRQAELGGTHGRWLSLARTAWWLVTAPAPPAAAHAPVRPDPDQPSWMVRLTSAQGLVTAVSPPGAIAGRALCWPDRLTDYGIDPPGWTPDPEPQS